MYFIDKLLLLSSNVFFSSNIEGSIDKLIKKDCTVEIISDLDLLITKEEISEIKDKYRKNIEKDKSKINMISRINLILKIIDDVKHLEHFTKIILCLNWYIDKVLLDSKNIENNMDLFNLEIMNFKFNNLYITEDYILNRSNNYLLNRINYSNYNGFDCNFSLIRNAYLKVNNIKSFEYFYNNYLFEKYSAIEISSIVIEFNEKVQPIANKIIISQKKLFEISEISMDVVKTLNLINALKEYFASNVIEV